MSTTTTTTTNTTLILRAHDPAAEGPKYVLGRSPQARLRLNQQQTLLMRSFNNQIFDPCIPHEKPGLEIADICCGTGAWALAAAPLIHDTSRIHAIDINPGMLPPAAWLPRSIVVHGSYNIYHQPPVEWREKFDVINLSLTLTFVTTVEQLQAVLDNVLSMLKPGGHLQQLEFDADHTKYLCVDPDRQLQHISNVVQAFWDLNDIKNVPWIAHMDQHLAARDEIDRVRLVRPPVDPLIAHEFVAILYVLMEEALNTFLQTHGQDTRAKREKVRKHLHVMEKADEEARLGVGYWFWPTRAIGQKKLNK